MPFLTFWDGPYSVYEVCFSLNKSTSYLSLCLSLNSFCNETSRTWASLSPETRCVISVGRRGFWQGSSSGTWVQVPIWGARFHKEDNYGFSIISKQVPQGNCTIFRTGFWFSKAPCISALLLQKETFPYGKCVKLLSRFFYKIHSLCCNSMDCSLPLPLFKFSSILSTSGEKKNYKCFPISH